MLIMRFCSTLTMSLIVGFSVASCVKEKKGGGRTPVSPGEVLVGDQHHTVLFIDDGFDRDHPILKDKVVGTYTITCDESIDDIDWSAGTIEDLKRKLFAIYAEGTPACTLTETLEFNKSPGFSTIASDREAWNKGILEKKEPSLPIARVKEMDTIINGSDGGYLYHGTATASVAAYQNPNVKMVLVQLKLRTASQADQVIDCHTQSAVDRYVTAHNDPALMDAYASQARDPLSIQLDEVIKRHKVTVANLSLGSFSRSRLEALYQQKGCGTVNLRSYFSLLRRMSEARTAWLKANGQWGEEVLVLQAAGNDAAKVESPEDTEQCSDPGSDTVIVGSHDLDGSLSAFSNYGTCVDLYALGHEVIVAAPEGFVTVKSGTSFAAPMAVRYLSLTVDAGLDARGMREALVARRDQARLLPKEAAPLELASDSSVAVAAYALNPQYMDPESAWQHFKMRRALLGRWPQAR